MTRRVISYGMKIYDFENLNNIELDEDTFFQIFQKAVTENSADFSSFVVVYSTTSFSQYPDDPSKRAILISETQGIAALHPKESIQYDFLEVEINILETLKAYFTTHQVLIPANIRVNLYQYIDGQRHFHSSITGTGKIYGASSPIVSDLYANNYSPSDLSEFLAQYDGFKPSDFEDETTGKVSFYHTNDPTCDLYQMHENYNIKMFDNTTICPPSPTLSADQGSPCYNDRTLIFPEEMNIEEINKLLEICKEQLTSFEPPKPNPMPSNMLTFANEKLGNDDFPNSSNTELKEEGIPCLPEADPDSEDLIKSAVNAYKAEREQRKGLLLGWKISKTQKFDAIDHLVQALSNKPVMLSKKDLTALCDGNLAFKVKEALLAAGRLSKGESLKTRLNRINQNNACQCLANLLKGYNAKRDLKAEIYPCSSLKFWRASFTKTEKLTAAWNLIYLLENEINNLTERDLMALSQGELGALVQGFINEYGQELSNALELHHKITDVRNFNTILTVARYQFCSSTGIIKPVNIKG